jgi:hypothetical protein
MNEPHRWYWENESNHKKYIQSNSCEVHKNGIVYKYMRHFLKVKLQDKSGQGGV